jgi:hypothetical protein
MINNELIFVMFSYRIECQTLLTGTLYLTSKMLSRGIEEMFETKEFTEHQRHLNPSYESPDGYEYSPHGRTFNTLGNVMYYEFLDRGSLKPR